MQKHRNIYTAEGKAQAEFPPQLKYNFVLFSESAEDLKEVFDFQSTFRKLKNITLVLQVLIVGALFDDGCDFRLVCRKVCRRAVLIEQNDNWIQNPNDKEADFALFLILHLGSESILITHLVIVY